jgi:hypothetical protein
MFEEKLCAFQASKREKSMRVGWGKEKRQFPKGNSIFQSLRLGARARSLCGKSLQLLTFMRMHFSARGALKNVARDKSSVGSDVAGM